LVTIDFQETQATLDKVKIVKSYLPISGGYIVSAIFEDETVMRKYDSSNKMIKETNEMDLHNGFYYHEFYAREY